MNLVVSPSSENNNNKTNFLFEYSGLRSFEEAGGRYPYRPWTMLEGAHGRVYRLKWCLWCPR
jgi:hypothetical protein